MYTKEFVKQNFLKELNEKQLLRQTLKEIGIEKLFEAAPFFISTFWFGFKDGKFNKIPHKVIYQTDHTDVNIYDNYMITYIEYFIKNCNLDSHDSVENNIESIIELGQVIDNEIARLYAKFDIDIDFDLTSDLYGFSTNIAILPDIFREEILFPLSQGDFDETLEPLIKKFLIKETLTK